jgi:HSP20 family molecular chaperone IbpA
MAFLCNSDFRPLFRLLDDYETHRSRPAPSRFTPAFDVRELNDGYYLDGELPGVDQSNIDIEFSDPQTLVIKGRTQRSYQNENENTDSQSGAPRWRQPTVEDEDADSTDTVTDDSVTPTDKVQPSFHYWASERSIGEFQRTFTFPTRVDQDTVRASLKNGILHVVVPKEAAPKTKKIRID